MLFAASCTQEKNSKELTVDEPTVPVIISFREPVALQIRTKAEYGMEMGEEPAISSLNVAVFGRDRYLKDYVSAFPCDENGNALPDGYADENGTTAYFLARLPISSSERVLHIIANGPSSLPFNAYENEIMQGLRVKEGNGAYWQRLVLPNGITIKETDGVPQQEANGEYIPSEETKAALSNISLVRNFAGITVSEEAENFEIIAYTLCNMPKSGSIAMYSTSHGDWVPGYTEPGVSLDNEYIYSYDGKAYPGFPTAPEIDTGVPTTVDAFNAPGVTVGPGQPIYVYERAVTADNAPFILMAARYVSSGEPTSDTPVHYYRLDLALENGYFPIYRNFLYTINITGVTVDGFEDPGNASRHNSGSNFSVSMDTQTLPDVSNGIVRLYVEQPVFDWVYNSDEQQFWFKFLLNSATSGNLNGSVAVTEKEGNAVASLTVNGSDSSDNERYVKYTLNEPDGTSTLSSTLQLVGTYTSGPETYRLVRTVVIRVFNAKEVEPTLTPSTVADQADQLTTLGIPLPWDLQASMFPMEILIEDTAKALNPMDYETMPVKTTAIDGSEDVFKSLTGDGKPSYCFVRTLNWSEYQRLKNSAEMAGSDDIILTCDFLTTKAFDHTTVYVYNKFFATDASGVTTAQVTLTGDKNNNITPNRQEISGTGASVTVKSTGEWTLSISLADGNVAAGSSLTPDSGNSTAGANVAVTLPENVTANAIRYLVTLTNTSENLTRTAYITQRGTKMTLTTSTTNISNEGASVSVSVESGARYVIEVLDADGNVLSTSSEYQATTGTAENQLVNIGYNPTLSRRTLTIRARNTLSTIWSDVTITQDAGVAALSAVDSEIMMQESTADIGVTTSMPTTLKVFNNDSGDEVTSVAVNTTASAASTQTVTVGSHTGSPVTYRAQLYDVGGNPIGNSITFVQKPMIRISAVEESVKGNANATVNVISDVDWTLSTTGGTLGSYSGTPTTGAEPVTLTLDVNYSLTNDEHFTVTAQGTGDNSSLSDAVEITHRKASENPNQTSTFTTRNSGLYASSRTATQNGITGEFSGISGRANSYITIAQGTSVHLTVADSNQVITITKVVFNFNSWGTFYYASDASQQVYTGTSGSVTAGDPTTWTGNASDFSVTLDRLLGEIRMTQFVVTYTGYKWE